MFAAQLQETTGARPQPAGEARGGARSGSRTGAGPSLGLSFSAWGMGRRVDSADGLRSTGSALLSASPTWKPHAHGKETDRHSRNGREPWTRDQCTVLTPPAAGFLSLHLRPQSPPPHNGGVGFFSPSFSPAGAGLRAGRGPQGIRGWSLAGPRAVFGLEVWPG